MLFGAPSLQLRRGHTACVQPCSRVMFIVNRRQDEYAVRRSKPAAKTRSHGVCPALLSCDVFFPRALQDFYRYDEFTRKFVYEARGTLHEAMDGCAASLSLAQRAGPHV
jgi:hypothetical protein